MRRDAGMFDVSHMCVVDLRGDRVRDYLRRLLANDVAKLTQPGKALYSCMLRENGGVIDDLIVYYMNDQWYRMVVNAGTRDKDLEWLRQVAAGYGVAVEPRTDLAMIAVQGPNARAKAASVMEPRSPPAHCRSARSSVSTPATCSSRAPATPAKTASRSCCPPETPWRCGRACACGVAPCGLGARDTLRLEAGMNLYGNDMDETTSPLESGLNWTIAWEPQDRDFIGRAALTAQKATWRHPQARRPAGRRPRGAALAPEGDRRHVGDGEVTSGTFSPTLQRSIGLARVPAGPATAAKSRSAASSSRHGWCARRSCATARSPSPLIFNTPQAIPS